MNHSPAQLAEILADLETARAESFAGLTTLEQKLIDVDLPAVVKELQEARKLLRGWQACSYAATPALVEQTHEFLAEDQAGGEG